MVIFTNEIFNSKSLCFLVETFSYFLAGYFFAIGKLTLFFFFVVIAILFASITGKLIEKQAIEKYIQEKNELSG